VCEGVFARMRTITLERNDILLRHLALWFILTISRSSSKVEDIVTGGRRCLRLLLIDSLEHELNINITGVDFVVRP